MSINRREFIQLMGMAAAAGMLPGCDNKSSGSAGVTTTGQGKAPEDMYHVPKFGNVTFMHMTDCHAQLKPVYFREPNVNLGLHDAKGRPPHIVGHALLDYYGIKPGTPEAHAFTYLNFAEAAEKYGKVGGFAHLQTLVKKLRADHGANRTLMMDGGDTWQGSGTAYWTRGKDMVGATNLLGVDVMTGHWEFTYHDEEVISNVKDFNGEFVCQNVLVKDEASFDYKFEDFEHFDMNSLHAFKPYTIKEMDGGIRVAIIGQAFPYTPIANPGERFIPDWTFGIRDQAMQAMVDTVRETEKPDAVVVISHNGMDVDIKMASQVSGIDCIFGGHTHDGMPGAMEVKNKGGTTLVTNAGSNGKFLGVMQFDIRNGKVQGYDYKLLPVFSNFLEPDQEMARYIEEVRKPYLDTLNEELAVADDVLYRRGNFNGTFDQLICDALREVGGAQISFSPGFRWGTTVLPGQPITMEHVLDQTCLTYPETYVDNLSGENIKLVLEDVADNIFHEDPYRQQGGDMVRVGGMDYTIDPTRKIGDRIKDMRLDDGTPIEANKEYSVAGWASVSPNPREGKDIWDVVAEYLRDQKVASVKKLNTPKLLNVQGNPGLADYNA
ncbi:thiosulfohydrolase SoxB [Thiohalophilus sp.]|uniref:thiosulfohydrolase SoxB n=1 Tax=Thiohalophilus sp. TaxID=3028392 RepID=UPI003976C955